MADGLSILAAYGDAEFSDAELKVIDTAVATYVFDTTGTVTLLNGAAVGSDFTDRIGRKSMFKSLLLQGLVAPVSGAVSSLNRIMLVYDTQPNGALAVVTDVLNTANAASMLNLNNRDRFEILWDEYFETGFYTAGAVADRTSRPVRQYQEFDLPTVYGGAGATVASVQTGALLLLTVGTQLAAAGATFVGAVRVRFVDS